MSRYGPDYVVQNRSGEELANAFQNLAQTVIAGRRRRQLDAERTQDRADQRLSRNAQLYTQGVRTGTAPNEDVTVTTPDVPSFAPKSNEMLARAFSGGSTDEAPPPDPFAAMPTTPMRRGSPLAQAPAAPSAATGPTPNDNEDMASAFDDPAKDRATGMGTAPAAPPNQGTNQGSNDGRNVAPLHPGAFDPATRTFGGGPMQQIVTATHALGGPSTGAPGGGTTTKLSNTNPRYVSLDDTHYIDTLHTPEAEHDRDREANLRLAAEFRQADIAARGTQSVSLEQERQKGRESLRDRINGAMLANTFLRGDIQGENQEAHDTRVGANQKAHDARVSARPSSQRGFGGNQAERNAMAAADGVIAASGGSYDAAVDWLNNTPEGKSASAAGLQPRHLYAALGKYLNHATDQTTRLEGSADLTPEEATGQVTRTRALLGGKQAITNDEYKALRAKGFDDASIRRKYTVKP